ncbi:unnamed protein product [Darwinula stevensoni]|uniref:PHA accumulation regulator DNA-binding N-terminal domain-containing protein n=1 Tax=Darwinula stevensoni TaxID=69355 RepID=A0A7R9AIY4_9CRUS|nr:unnamed protein product [Darwinula stevensoni]CAG0906848.1 unnamed protein product [Darwinula stevensoni]
MKTIIKRYPNRKLYNTEAKRYITLDGIADLIQHGQDIQIIDHTSGEDLTTTTLTQIIFEQQKKDEGFLSQPFLTSLIRAGESRLYSLWRSVEGGRAFVEAEIERRVQELINRGEIQGEEGKEMKRKLLGWRWHDLPVVNTVEQAWQRYNLPSTEEVKELLGQPFDALSHKLNEVLHPTPPVPPSADSTPPPPANDDPTL